MRVLPAFTFSSSTAAAPPPPTSDPPPPPPPPPPAAAPAAYAVYLNIYDISPINISPINNYLYWLLYTRRPMHDLQTILIIKPLRSFSSLQDTVRLHIVHASSIHQSSVK